MKQKWYMQNIEVSETASATAASAIFSVSAMCWRYWISVSPLFLVRNLHWPGSRGGIFCAGSGNSCSIRGRCWISISGPKKRPLWSTRQYPAICSWPFCFSSLVFTCLNISSFFTTSLPSCLWMQLFTKSVLSDLPKLLTWSWMLTSKDSLCHSTFCSCTDPLGDLSS